MLRRMFVNKIWFLRSLTRHALQGDCLHGWVSSVNKACNANKYLVSFFGMHLIDELKHSKLSNCVLICLTILSFVT